MRLSTLSVAAPGIAALILCSASAAPAASSDVAPSGVNAVQRSTDAVASALHGFPKKKGCGFTNGTIDGGNWITSQDIYDFGIVSDAADDFRCVKATTLKSLRWQAAYNESPGPAEWFDVFVYADKGGEPSDTAMCSYLNQSYKATGDPSYPQITIKRLSGDACHLARHTTYWLEQRAHMSYQDGGQIGWEVTSVLTGNAADWRNPDGGFGSSCGVFQNDTDMQTCLGLSGTPDFIFSVK